MSKRQPRDGCADASHPLADPPAATRPGSHLVSGPADSPSAQEGAADCPPVAPSNSPAPSTAACKQDRSRLRPYRPRRFKHDSSGGVLGGGGEKCPACRASHDGAVACEETALLAAGWKRQRGRNGRVEWRTPKAAQRDRERKRAIGRSKRTEALIRVASIANQPAVERALEAARRPVEVEIPAIDPGVARVWLSVARARVSGVAAGQIAETLNISRTEIERLIADPRYQLFDAEYRLHLRDEGEIERLRAQLLADMTTARETVLHWMKQRGDAASGLSVADAGRLSLAAARTVAEWSGFASGGTGARGVAGVRAIRRDLPDGRVEFLLEAAAKVGA